MPRDDATAYQSMLKRGIEEVDTSPHKAAGDAVALKTRKQLAGHVYSKSSLAAVEAAAAKAQRRGFKYLVRRRAT